MGLSGSIFGKVKKSISRIMPNPATTSRHADFMVKMNLPPLMGRRDAAYDRAATMSRSDFFSLAEEEQRRQVQNLCLLLDRSIEDTRAILSTLSSPDTQSREERLLKLLGNVRALLSVLEKLSLSKDYFFSGSNDSDALYSPASNLSNFSRDEEMLSECEINLVNHIRFIFEEVEPKIERYREYMTKSFSHSYAERYQHAVTEYAAYYAELTKRN